jgi:hypothetical protein
MTVAGRGQRGRPVEILASAVDKSRGSTIDHPDAVADALWPTRRSGSGAPKYPLSDRSLGT